MKTGVVWKLGLTVVVGSGAAACDIDPCGDAGCPGLTAGTDSRGDRGDDDDDDDGDDGDDDDDDDDTGGDDGDGSGDTRGDDDDDDDDDTDDDDDDDDDTGDDDDDDDDDTGDDDDDDDDDTGDDDDDDDDTGGVTGEPIDSCPTVARAAEISCGRLLLWGDEHIRFDDNYALTSNLWSQAVSWLAEPGECNTNRDTVYFGFSTPGTLEADLVAAGYTIANAFDDSVDIVIMDANFLGSSGQTAAEIQAFVANGGALMTTVIGFGDAEECDEPNDYLEPLGVAYDCAQAPPWGDQLALTDHPVTAGLDESTIPFVNGRWVVDAGAGSVPVALHGAADAYCYEPPPPPPPPTAQCNTVGRTTKPGCGRVFAWGDEHVTFEDYYPGTAGFWDNTLAWLATSDCAEDRTHLWLATNLSDSVEAQLAGMGFTISSGQPDPSTLGPSDIVIGADYTGADVAAAQAWVEDGGAMMTMIVGLGDGLPSECNDANALLTGLGMSYDCTVAAPWGPVTSFAPHPIGAGLIGDDAPFVNGRWVLDEDGTSSVVAYVDPSGECTDPSDQPIPPDPQ